MPTFLKIVAVLLAVTAVVLVANTDYKKNREDKENDYRVRADSFQQDVIRDDMRLQLSDSNAPIDSVIMKLRRMNHDSLK